MAWHVAWVIPRRNENIQSGMVWQVTLLLALSETAKT
jgi:hypothetical protein